MPVNLQTARAWNQALMSIYYYGRKTTPRFEGQATPRSVIPLGKAVGVLVSSREKDVIRPVRMALADLCRTRAAGKDLLVDQQIALLASALHRLGGVVTKPEPEIVESFARIFAGDSPVDPHDAYVRAMTLMTELQAG